MKKPTRPGRAACRGIQPVLTRRGTLNFTKRLVGPCIFVACLVVAISLFLNRNPVELRKRAAMAAIANGRWICYSPTHYDPRRSIFPTARSIRDDLRTLKNPGFNGVITYESRGPQSTIPAIAHELGLLVIQGIWDPANASELRKAIKQKAYVVAYCVGNDGLKARYGMSDLDNGVAYVANATGLPVAVSEQIHLYFMYPDLTRIGDFLFPIVHPHFAGKTEIKEATQWIIANTERLKALASKTNPNIVVFCKEVGMPSAGQLPYSEERQAQFFAILMNQSEVRFAVFEAFDRAGWRYGSDIEEHWGIYREDRRAKAAAAVVKNAFTRKTLSW